MVSDYFDPVGPWDVYEVPPPHGQFKLRPSAQSIGPFLKFYRLRAVVKTRALYKYGKNLKQLFVSLKTQLGTRNTNNSFKIVCFEYL